MAEVRAVFKKTGGAAFISHLDMSRLFVRALNRAKIRVKYTNGFNPHAYIVFSIPLSLGYESLCELVEFETLDDISSDELKYRLNDALPEGIEVVSCSEKVSKQKEIAYSDWDIILERDTPVYDTEEAAIKELFSSKEIRIVKETKRGQSEINLMNKVKSASVSRKAENSLLISARLTASQDDVLNPEYLVRAIREKLSMEFDDVYCTRKAFLKKNGELFR